MRVLLDTHAFLWFITDDPKLSAVGRTTIADPGHEILISPASYWEIAIKVSLGKYPLSVPFETFITQGIEANTSPSSRSSRSMRRPSRPCRSTIETRSTGC